MIALIGLLLGVFLGLVFDVNIPESFFALYVSCDFSMFRFCIWGI